jgi:hypothetical protein
MPDGRDGELDEAIDEALEYAEARRALDESVAAIAGDADRLWGIAPTIEPSLPAPPARKRATVAERVRAVFARPRPVRPLPLLRRPVLPLHQRLTPRPRREPGLSVPSVPLAPWERRARGRMKEEAPMVLCENGHLLTPTDRFCRTCGTPAAKVCKTCGQAVPAATARRAVQRAADEAADGEAADDEVLEKAGAVLPGVADIPADQLLFKAIQADRGLDKLSTYDVAKLETYAGNGFTLHDIAQRDPQLAVRAWRAVSPGVSGA